MIIYFLIYADLIFLLWFRGLLLIPWKIYSLLSFADVASYFTQRQFFAKFITKWSNPGRSNQHSWSVLDFEIQSIKHRYNANLAKKWSSGGCKLGTLPGGGSVCYTLLIYLFVYFIFQMGIGKSKSSRVLGELPVCLFLRLDYCALL